MSPALSQHSRQYYDNYCGSLSSYAQAARLAETFVEEAVADAGIEYDSVAARVKDPDSLLRKLRARGYENPTHDLTDGVGVRVSVHYRDGVDASVDAIKARVAIDESRSVDKRSQLSIYEFGYRSVHLIARLGDIGLDIPDDVEDSWFEIQVRSVLEHAWAEIEHEVVYKSGVSFSDETLRSFAAVAGTLELMDGQFEGFRAAIYQEVSNRGDGLLGDGEGWTADLDAAGVIAVFEALAPRNPGWRSSPSLPPHSARMALEALRATGLTTGQAVRLAFGAPGLAGRVETFAALSGVAATDVSHLALAALVVGSQRGFSRSDFADLFNDPVLTSALGDGP